MPQEIAEEVEERRSSGGRKKEEGGGRGRHTLRAEDDQSFKNLNNIYVCQSAGNSQLATCSSQRETVTVERCRS